MVRGSLKILVCLLTIALAVPAQAQSDGQVSKEWTSAPGPKKHLATIIFSGLAGGVLGLSTLSFYGRPQDKLGNITLGVGIGIIAGTIYVVYNAARNPRDFYGNSGSSSAWLDQEEDLLRMRLSTPPPQALKIGFQF